VYGLLISVFISSNVRRKLMQQSL